MEKQLCFCGHDCSRCLVRLASMTEDPGKAAVYREKVRAFYRDQLHREIQPEKILCLGGRSERVMEACRSCPFLKCCTERGIERCTDCAAYPCAEIRAYEDRWVNKALQIPEIP